MNYFDTDNREFAKHFVKYGLIPTDKELQYDASEESAMGGYVHPMKDLERIKKQNRNKHEDKDIKTENMSKKQKRFTESDLHRIVKESVQKILAESYSTNYDELIKDEMHRLYELEQKVPQWIQPEIHSMVVTMEGILQEIKRNHNFDY